MKFYRLTEFKIVFFLYKNQKWDAFLRAIFNYFISNRRLWTFRSPLEPFFIQAIFKSHRERFFQRISSGEVQWFDSLKSGLFRIAEQAF